LPSRHFRDDILGDGADQIRETSIARLYQEGLNLTDRQAAGMEPDDFVINAPEAPPRVYQSAAARTSLAIARDSIATGPSSVRTVFPLVPCDVSWRARLGGCGWVAEVVCQLAAQRTLNQRLLEPSRTRSRFFGSQRPVTNDLIKEFSRERRQCFGRRLRSAGIQNLL
jgi:hypothetical protein